MTRTSYTPPVLRDSTALTTGEATMPRYGVHTSAVGTATGRLHLVFFTALNSGTLTQISITTGGTAAAATPTLCRMGVYEINPTTLAGTLVASIANDTTLFAATNTSYTRSFTSSFSRSAGTRYAVGLLVVTGAAAPTFYGNNGMTSGGSTTGGAAAHPRLAATIASQTDLPASFTEAGLGNSAAVPFMAYMS